MADGFDIHHLDGNHDNNDPFNLLLVEVMDHMRLHDLSLQRISAMEIRSSKKRTRDAKDDVLGVRRGAFISKIIKGKKYWYFQDNRTRKQLYVGLDTTHIRRKLELYQKYKDADDQVSAWNCAKDLISS